jgi:hypothetical protein
MINPFRCESDGLLNISTGQKALSADLIHAKEKGLAALDLAEKTHSNKVEPIKLQTFVEKNKKTSQFHKKLRRCMNKRAVWSEICTS